MDNFSASLFPGSNNNRSDRMRAMFGDVQSNLAVFYLQLEGSVKDVDARMNSSHSVGENEVSKEAPERVKITSRMFAFLKPLDHILSKSTLRATNSSLDEELMRQSETSTAANQGGEQPKSGINQQTKDQAAEIARNVDINNLAKTSNYNIMRS